MNRRKKATKIFDKRLKKARSKLAPKNQPNGKPKYISKAERAKLDNQSQHLNETSDEITDIELTNAEPNLN